MKSIGFLCGKTDRHFAWPFLLPYERRHHYQWHLGYRMVFWTLLQESAKVVFPVPGGPHKIMDDSIPESNCNPMEPLGPTRCCC